MATSATKKLVTGTKSGAKIAPKSAAKTTAEKPAAKTAAPKATAAKTAGTKTATKPKTTAASKAKASSDMIVKTSKEIETLTADKAFHAIPALLDNKSLSDFKIGGMLTKIQEDPDVWASRGYESFRKLIEGEFNLPYRKSMHLIKIYKNLIDSGVAWDAVKDIGWTKLKEIVCILNVDNAEHWVTKAKNLSTIQLVEEVKAAIIAAEQEELTGDEGEGEDTGTQTGPSDTVKVSTLTFKLHEDQRETVEAAMDKAGKATGSTVNAVLLDYICTDYLAGGEKKVKGFAASKVTDSQLGKVFEHRGAEEILKVFGEIFPEIELEAALPDDGEEEEADEGEEEEQEV